MEFGKHLGKGLWGIADKALPVVYGVSYVVLVIRVLPEEEFGSFVLIQEIFLILSNLAAAFALHPLLKFAAEERAEQRDTIGAALLLNLAFIVVSSLLIVAVQSPLASLLNAPSLEGLMIFVVAMLVANFIRNFTLALLQTRFRVQQVFWIDAAHFLVAPALIYLFSKLHMFNTAHDLLIINVISLSVSSLVGIWLAWPMLKFNLRPHRDEMKRMWDYGKYSIVTILSSMLFMKSDSFILSAFAGPTRVAVYNSAKIFVRIYDMVAQVVQMFVFPATSKLSATGESLTLNKLLEKALAFTTLSMLPVFGAFLCFSPSLVSLIYGDRYPDAATLLRVFAVVAVLIPTAAVASNFLMGLAKVRLIFWLSIIVLIGSWVLYLALIPAFGIVGAALAYVLASALQMLLFGYYMRRYAGIRFASTVARVKDIWFFLLSRIGK